jgi:NADH-quinone oxidoreductase subunit M
LPDAHVEAPTPISMILAGLLLKMGAYGLMRICVGFFPNAIIQLGTLLMVLGGFNIIWAAIACMVQEDMKRIIAFSSVSHMGFILLGIGSLSAAAFSGAIFQMISHGFISALLFFLVGTLYERMHTRSISVIGGGLANQIPTLFYFWMFAALANLGLPALSGFVGEATVLYGAFTSPTAALPHAWLAKSAVIFACTGVVLTAGYMLWLLKRLFFGEANPKWAGHFGDATFNEIQIASIFAVLILALGVYPLMLTNLWSNYTDSLSLDLKTRSMDTKH